MDLDDLSRQAFKACRDFSITAQRDTAAGFFWKNFAEALKKYFIEDFYFFLQDNAQKQQIM